MWVGAVEKDVLSSERPSSQSLCTARMAYALRKLLGASKVLLASLSLISSNSAIAELATCM